MNPTIHLYALLTVCACQGTNTGFSEYRYTGSFQDTPGDETGTDTPDTADSDLMNMDQTLSDGAQRNTIAASGFAMVTGNLQAQSFFPPGKVADYWGFQFLRDNDPDGMGHNTSFLTRVANNVLYILNADQLAALTDLAVVQADQINQYAYDRYPLMNAFLRQLEGDLPEGATALNRDAVRAASRDLYRLDGQMSFDRAVVFADVYRSLDASQEAWLDAMVGQGFDSWPDISDEQIDEILRGLPPGSSVAVRTYAGDLFAWYAGSVEADVYFCPERQGTYFGSFYLKDAPAIGHEGYSIDEQLTADVGQEFLDVLAETGLDTLVSDLVDSQRDDLYAGETNIVAARQEIATLLRSLISEDAPTETFKDQVLENVLASSHTYGELDGDIVYDEAMAFAEVHGSQNADQEAALWALRGSILTGTYDDGTPFDFSVCEDYYLYSDVITDPSALDPYLDAAEDLFFEP